MMTEDKQLILDLLLTCLQQTSGLWDLTDLEYVDSREEVIATFANGHRKTVNVALDSGTAMICDVIRRIV